LQHNFSRGSKMSETLLNNRHEVVWSVLGHINHLRHEKVLRKKSLCATTKLQRVSRLSSISVICYSHIVIKLTAIQYIYWMGRWPPELLLFLEQILAVISGNIILKSWQVPNEKIFFVVSSRNTHCTRLLHQTHENIHACNKSLKWNFVWGHPTHNKFTKTGIVHVWMKLHHLDYPKYRHFWDIRFP